MTLAATQARQPLTPERDTLSANSEHRLALVTPEFQDQLDIAWNDLNSWVAFRVRTQLVQNIYQGDSLDVNLVQMRDEIVIPEYTRQRRIAIDEAEDVHARLLPGLKLRTMIAENDISEAQSQGDTSRLRRRTDDLANLSKDAEMAHMKARIKETTAASIHSLLTAENQDGINRQVDKVTRRAKKEALREVIQVLDSQMRVIRGGAQEFGIDEDAARVLVANEHKIEALRAELQALEGVESYTRDTEELMDEPATVEAKEPWQEKMHPRAIMGSLAGAAMSLQVSLFK